MTTPADELAQRPRRIRRLFANSRAILRLVHRDPEHVAERLTLYAVERLQDETRDWARVATATRPEAPQAELAEELRLRSAQIARIDGAISGTPFLIALVPGYLIYLLQEMRMTLRTAALYGRDPGDLRTAAEMLALRGMHPSVEAAEEALVKVRDTPPPPPSERRPLRTWVHSGFQLAVFGGFLSPSSGEPPRKGWRDVLRTGFSLAVAGAIWVLTWVLPLTFMIAMAWGCETHTRQLGRRALVFYDGEAASASAAIAVADRRHDRGHDKRALVRSLALFLSVAVPIAFVGYVQHVRNTVGLNWLGALGALVALSLVMATAIVSSRR